MPAYIMVNCRVIDAEQYEEYKRLAQAAVAQYGGRYLVRGGESVILEGTWRPNRIVVLNSPRCNRRRYSMSRRSTARRVPLARERPKWT